MEEMTSVVPDHRAPRNFSDWAAWKIVRFARFWMDKATGMDREQQVDKKNPTTAVEAQQPLTEAQWVSTEPPLGVVVTTACLAGQSLLTLVSLSASSSSRASPACPEWLGACSGTSTACAA